MSQKIPFLQMFAALRQWTELSNGVEGWLIVSAAIDKASRSAKIAVEGAAGAGPNLIAQAEETLARAYGLNSVKIEALAPAPETDGDRRKGAQCEPADGRCLPPQDASEERSAHDEDPFARTEALRRAAMKNAVRPAAPGKWDKKPQG